MEDFSVSNEEEIHDDFTDEDSQVFKSTNVSGVPSPVIYENEPKSKEQALATEPKLIQKVFDMKNFKLDFDDLNECVAVLLKKAKDDNGGRDIKKR